VSAAASSFLQIMSRISIAIEIQSSHQRENPGISCSYAGINRIRFKGFLRVQISGQVATPKESGLF
jgi:hypothetical protein